MNDGHSRTGPQDLGSRHKDRAAVLAHTRGRCDLQRQGVDIRLLTQKAGPLAIEAIRGGGMPKQAAPSHNRDKCQHFQTALANQCNHARLRRSCEVQPWLPNSILTV